MRMGPMAVRDSREPVPLLRQAWPQVQVRAGPPFFGLVGLLLQGGGQAVAEELSSPSEQEVLAGVEHRPEGGLPGLLFQMAAELRSEEHTSELQSLTNLVCRLLLEKKKPVTHVDHHHTDSRAV